MKKSEISRLSTSSRYLPTSALNCQTTNSVGSDEPRGDIMAALTAISSSLEAVGNDLETYLCYDEEHGTKILTLLRNVFNYNKEDERTSGRIVKGCPLDELETKDFDHEQLWQQIQLQNESFLNQSSIELKNLLKNQCSIRLSCRTRAITTENTEKLKNTVKQKKSGRIGGDGQSDVVGDDYSGEGNASNSNDNYENERKHVNNADSKRWNKQVGSVVDDQFFKLAEMEKFLEMEEKRDERKKNYLIHDDSDSDDIDLFANYHDESEQDVSDLDEPKLCDR